MITKRIIACLDVRNGRVVKACSLWTSSTLAIRPRRPRATPAKGRTRLCCSTLPRPTRAAARCSTRCAARPRIVRPLCVGGGIRSATDAAQVFEAGADKVSINSAALARPQLIEEIGRSFGAQAVVVAIDARRDPRPPIRSATRRSSCRAGASWLAPRRRVGARG